ncbi:MAG: GNAT family N-acetyltransferase [Balneolaceae bacterium]|nr:GNAT family N-acetyltransferase [Balneolaceae bacterium]
MQWIHALSMDDLSVLDLYKMLKLRQDIFIIEQDCIYDDIDNIDPFCEHLLLKDGNKVIACSRIVPAGKKFDDPSIGRIAVDKNYRGRSLGKKLVQKSLDILSKTNTDAVIIEAQSYLLAFYESLGFQKTSDAYPVDGIPHNKMIYQY